MYVRPSAFAIVSCEEEKAAPRHIRGNIWMKNECLSLLWQFSQQHQNLHPRAPSLLQTHSALWVLWLLWTKMKESEMEKGIQCGLIKKKNWNESSFYGRRHTKRHDGITLDSFALQQAAHGWNRLRNILFAFFLGVLSWKFLKWNLGFLYLVHFPLCFK